MMKKSRKNTNDNKKKVIEVDHVEETNNEVIEVDHVNETNSVGH